MSWEPVRYMEWAKEVPPRARWRLSASGMNAPPADALGTPPGWAETMAEADLAYGNRRLDEAIAVTYGVDPANVLVTGGTSEANFVALAAILRSGDRVAVETPVYEPLLAACRALGARVVPVRRDPGRGFEPDRDDVFAALRAGARAVVLTRLHNPSGADLAPGLLAELAEACSASGSVLLLDEVYRDWLGAAAGPVAAVLGPSAITTASLTKVYGLGGLRVGWVLAAPSLVSRMRTVRDHLEVVSPSPSLAWALRAFARLDALRVRAVHHAEEGRDLVASLVAGRPDLAWTPPAGGLCGAVRLSDGWDDRDFAASLLAAGDTVVVPGSFFQLPGWIRVGWGEDAAHTREALRRLGAHLDAFRIRSCRAGTARSPRAGGG